MYGQKRFGRENLNQELNTIMENFFGLMKQEIYYSVIYYSYVEL
jgi:hypothetical protein